MLSGDGQRRVRMIADKVRRQLAGQGVDVGGGAEGGGATAVVQQLPPCPLLLPPTGELVPCEACGDGRVQLKVFGCRQYGTCLPGIKLPGRACCVGCPARPVVAELSVRVS